MAWKKDLAKLKQDLGKEEGLPGKVTPPPKPRPSHPLSQSIEEEDNIFLNAMGLRPKSGGPRPAEVIREETPAVIQPKPAPQESKVEFASAMGDLRGLKPMKGLPQEAAPAPVQAAPTPAPAPPPPEPPAALEAPEPEEAPAIKESGPAVPAQALIQLAAGMAIVVDGSLDLKGHARSDAEERLKERLLDGYALGWRTLHVVVGASEDLRQMVLDLLASPAGRCVARYAQAPVPMGGAQAWILYFRGQGSPEN